jgi:formate hydrogenlyase subunit 3/multisubunit Na+/H+ antiporter MnhD subunit
MLTYLLLIIAFIPLLNALVLSYAKSPALISLSGKILPIFSAIILIGIHQNLDSEGFSLVILPIFNDVSFGFLLNSSALIFLSLLTFLWIIFSFYSAAFFELVEFDDVESFQKFFNLNIATLTLIILSKNLLTSLVFYHLLILISLFFALNFLYKDRDRFSSFFTALFYLKSLLIFLAIIFTYKIFATLEFTSEASSGQIVSAKAQFALLALYFCALFLFLIAPFYLLYRRNINNEPAIIYNFFLLPHAFASLFVFSRILNFIFTFEVFGDLIDKINFVTIEVIFLLLLILPSLLLIFSKSLKSSFFYLFFHRFTFALFALLFFAKFDVTRINLPIYAFLIEFTLLFLVFSNLNIYFSQSDEKKFEGLFYKMPITCSLIIFVFASMIGFAPTTGTLEIFLILKIAISKNMWLSLCFLVFSGASLSLFFFKSFRFVFLTSAEKLSLGDESLAKDIDGDSNLILTAITAAIALFSLLIINFFHHL